MGWHKSCPLVCVSQDIPLHEGSPTNPVQMALGCLIPGGCHSALQLWIMAGCRLKTTVVCSESALTLAAHMESFPQEVLKRGHAVLSNSVAKLSLPPSQAALEAECKAEGDDNYNNHV